MKIIIKLLGKAENEIEVLPSTSVGQLKTQVQHVFNVATNLQKLVFKGKTLADDTEIGSHNISEGDKIFLFVKKAHDAGHVKPAARVSKGPLFDKMEVLLLKHFPKESVPTIMENFEKEIFELPNMLSLEDIERISKANIEDGRNTSWCGRS